MGVSSRSCSFYRQNFIHTRFLVLTLGDPMNKQVYHVILEFYLLIKFPSARFVQDYDYHSIYNKLGFGVSFFINLTFSSLRFRAG